ncbi:MAG: hypothetical protein ACLPY5_02495 [Candidatus Bathyarchaeia archaeon]
MWLASHPVIDIRNFVSTGYNALFAYPREIEFVDQIPRTVTDKIKRFELRTAEESVQKM